MHESWLKETEDKKIILWNTNTKFTIHTCISVTALYMQWQNNKEVYSVRPQSHFWSVAQVATLEATSFLVYWRAVWTIFPSSCIVYLMYISCCSTLSFFSPIGLFWRWQVCWYKFQHVVFTFTTKATSEAMWIVRLEVAKAVIMGVTIFWNMTGM